MRTTEELIDLAVKTCIIDFNIGGIFHIYGEGRFIWTYRESNGYYNVGYYISIPDPSIVPKLLWTRQIFDDQWNLQETDDIQKIFNWCNENIPYNFNVYRDTSELQWLNAIDKLRTKTLDKHDLYVKLLEAVVDCRTDHSRLYYIKDIQQISYTTRDGDYMIKIPTWEIASALKKTTGDFDSTDKWINVVRWVKYNGYNDQPLWIDGQGLYANRKQHIFIQDTTMYPETGYPVATGADWNWAIEKIPTMNQDYTVEMIGRVKTMVGGSLIKFKEAFDFDKETGNLVFASDTSTKMFYCISIDSTNYAIKVSQPILTTIFKNANSTENTIRNFINNKYNFIYIPDVLLTNTHDMFVELPQPIKVGDKYKILNGIRYDWMVEIFFTIYTKPDQMFQVGGWSYYVYNTIDGKYLIFLSKATGDYIFGQSNNKTYTGIQETDAFQKILCWGGNRGSQIIIGGDDDVNGKKFTNGSCRYTIQNKLLTNSLIYLPYFDITTYIGSRYNWNTTTKYPLINDNEWTTVIPKLQKTILKPMDASEKSSIAPSIKFDDTNIKNIYHLDNYNFTQDTNLDKDGKLVYAEKGCHIYFCIVSLACYSIYIPQFIITHVLNNITNQNVTLGSLVVNNYLVFDSTFRNMDNDFWVVMIKAKHPNLISINPITLLHIMFEAILKSRNNKDNITNYINVITDLNETFYKTTYENKNYAIRILNDTEIDASLNITTSRPNFKKNNKIDWLKDCYIINGYGLDNNNNLKLMPDLFSYKPDKLDKFGLPDTTKIDWQNAFAQFPKLTDVSGNIDWFKTTNPDPKIVNLKGYNFDSNKILILTDDNTSDCFIYLLTYQTNVYAVRIPTTIADFFITDKSAISIEGVPYLYQDGKTKFFEITDYQNVWYKLPEFISRCNTEILRLQQVKKNLENELTSVGSTLTGVNDNYGVAKSSNDDYKKTLNDINEQIAYFEGLLSVKNSEISTKQGLFNNKSKEYSDKNDKYRDNITSIQSIDTYKQAALIENETLNQIVIPALNANTNESMNELYNSIQKQTAEIRKIIKSISNSTLTGNKKTMNVKDSTTYANGILNVMFVLYYVVYVILLYIVFNKQSMALPIKMLFYIFFFSLPFFVGIYSVYFSNNVRVYTIIDSLYDIYASVTLFFNGMIRYVLNMLGINYIGSSISSVYP